MRLDFPLPELVPPGAIPEPAPPPPAAADLAEMRELARSIDAAGNQVDALKAFLAACRRTCDRAVLLVSKGDALAVWKAEGFSPSEEGALRNAAVAPSAHAEIRGGDGRHPRHGRRGIARFDDPLRLRRPPRAAVPDRRPGEDLGSSLRRPDRGRIGVRSRSARASVLPDRRRRRPARHAQAPPVARAHADPAARAGAAAGSRTGSRTGSSRRPRGRRGGGSRAGGGAGTRAPSSASVAGNRFRLDRGIPTARPPASFPPGRGSSAVRSPRSKKTRTSTRGRSRASSSPTSASTTRRRSRRESGTTTSMPA